MQHGRRLSVWLAVSNLLRLLAAPATPAPLRPARTPHGAGVSEGSGHLGGGVGECSWQRKRAWLLCGAGFGADGQMGDGSYASSLVPVEVAGGHRFATISAGGAYSSNNIFTCGTTLEGGGLCWGA